VVDDAHNGSAPVPVAETLRRPEGRRAHTRQAGRIRRRTSRVLEWLDRFGKFSWATDGTQTEAGILGNLEKLHGLGVDGDRLRRAMRAVGYDEHDLEALQRLQAKRTSSSMWRT
jgi:hypothetical protein